VAPVCTNCGSTDFVWAGELKTGGRLSAGQLSLRQGGELPLGTRICRTCGHADLFLRDTRILQAPHEWKPGEFVPIRTQPPATPSAPPPSPAPSPPPSAPAPAPSMATPPPPPPPTNSPAAIEAAPAAMSPPAEAAPDPGPSGMAPPESPPAADSGAESAKPKAARRRSSRAKKAADEPEG
jgi:hypothetical protein